MKRHTFIEIIVFLFVLLFTYAALMKLLDYEKFKVQLDQSPLLVAFAGWVAWFVPSLELIIVGLLLLHRTRLIALYASFTIMVMFTAYISFILFFAPSVPCSCGGILEKMGWGQHLVFNIAFVILGAVGVILTIKRESVSEVELPKIATT